ncbi:dynamin family protein [Streptomyces sp. JJ38]|uniref:dynamin family protein n=1 Tax=Streptomyces sp. JJ38 TaxID=2738128 RepID=UPI001C56F36A|nr:dynamin family protein [Streptomyces sp. JJ38]
MVRLAALCASLGPRLPEPAATVVAATAARLAEPTLRIAVGGRLNAGKSTLVNALLGQSLAATGATECTRLVTWYRSGPQNRVLVRRRDGRSYYVPGTAGGGVPEESGALGTDAGAIAELVVETPNQALERSYRLVDTPGMDSLSGLDDLAMTALDESDALLYVMPHPGESDVEVLEALRRHSSRGVTAARALGVLSRIDELGRGTGDPWRQADRLCTTYARRLTGLVADVVPVAGLLAQASRCERFTDHDTESVALLAALPYSRLEQVLRSADVFLSWPDGPLGSEDRRRLLSLLGRYGILEAVRCHAGESTRALLAGLRARSGLDALEERLRREFVDRADHLRAATALRALTAVAHGLGPDGPGRELRSELALVRRHPVVRQAALSVALADLASGRLVLSESRVRALMTLARGRTAAECLGLSGGAPAAETAARAASEAGSWRAYEAAPQRVVREHARAARMLCEALYFATGAHGARQ